ncbi:MAG: prolipoprotein diacylglyceryl transferase, partial [Nocardioidaceae bacterium]|nr:prolipoprotein diacylglyceryl transferase [Nocardioidaceae bacterium]
GRAFALYVAAYTAGRVWIEALRIDDAEMIGPFRLNVWTSIVVFVLAVAYIVVVGRRHPGRETSVYRDERGPRTDFTEPRGRGAGVETTARD